MVNYTLERRIFAERGQHFDFKWGVIKNNHTKDSFDGGKAFRLRRLIWDGN
jgi:hypothetical protein